MRRPLALLFLLPAVLLAQAPSNPMTQDAIEAFKKQDYETARMLFESVLATNPRDPAAQNYLRMIAMKQKDGTASRSDGLPNLNRLIIPKIEFTDATPREAFAFVSQKVRDLSPDKKPLNIVWLVPEGAAVPNVTLNLQNIPANDALRYIAEGANLELEYDTYAVKVSSTGATAQPATASNAAAYVNLQRVILPKVDFNGVNARDALDFVSQSVRKLSPSQQPLNVVWLVPEGTDLSPITLSLQNIPAAEVMNYIAQTAGLKFDYDAYAVKVSPLAK